MNVFNDEEAGLWYVSGFHFFSFFLSYVMMLNNNIEATTYSYTREVLVI